MIKTNYFYDYISNMLASGHSTAIPREILEKEGIKMEELNAHFLTKQGPYGLICFLKMRKQIS